MNLKAPKQCAIWILLCPELWVAAIVEPGTARTGQSRERGSLRRKHTGAWLTHLPTLSPVF